MTNFSLFKNLFPWFFQEEEVQALALQVENRVRRLNALPPTSEANYQDTTAILKSICLLLDRLEEHPRLVNQEQSKISEKTDLSKLPKQSDEQSFTGKKAIHLKHDAAEENSSNHQTVEISKIEFESEPSSTAKELIKLRDWVLLANAENSSGDRRILDNLYRKLGQILTKEEITSLEADGSFNYEQQQVVDTQATNDPALDNLICSTVRPGYLFNQKLIRPQEVIVYTFINSTAPLSDS